MIYTETELEESSKSPGQVLSLLAGASAEQVLPDCSEFQDQCDNAVSKCHLRGSTGTFLPSGELFTFHETVMTSNVTNHSPRRLYYQNRKSQDTPEIVKILGTCFNQVVLHILKKRN